ncbi:MAG: cation:proton antiporter domain-containing protein [Planctomycetota bacterium]|jgi:Kef-type K+ transport system membrane component KefB
MMLASASGGTGMEALLILGGALFLGTLGARLLRWLHFPQVLGYILIGLIVGESVLGLITADLIQRLSPFNFLALGVIGFMIGGELHLDAFKRFGRQFIIILLAEGLAAFVVVAAGTIATTYLITGNARLSCAIGLVLGAISAATAPAATARVLREYKTRGVLTQTVFAILALDDGLALVLFGVASSIAARLLPQAASAGQDGGMLMALLHTAKELLGGAALGAGAGIGLNWLLRRRRDHDRALTYTVGTLTLVIGISHHLGLDTILAAMALGVAITNLAPRRSGSAIEIVERFAPPIYVLFFVLVGAHLHIGKMAWPLAALAGVYVIARSAGKIVGANVGGRLASAAPSVRKYLGLCLFCQGGVSVGLALMAGERFRDVMIFDNIPLGVAIVTIITATTFIVELLGPPLVKRAAHKAGEVGLDVTEEDLMASYTVADMVDRSAPTFNQGAPLSVILRTIADTDAETYPVVNEDKRLVGIITLSDLKQGFGAEGLTAWLVAFDLMEPVPDTVGERMPLADAVDRMHQEHLECVPVLSDDADGQLVGVLEMRRVSRILSQEILRRRQLADASAG